MNKTYRWLVKQCNPDAVQQLKQNSTYSENFCKILVARGLYTIDKVQSFLNPTWENIHHYNKFLQMEKAVQRINHAIDHNENIAIYGDYDADGVTATSVLYQCFKLFNANITYYIPERNEGYGVKSHAIDKLHKEKVSLIITVDCGISNYTEVEYAKSLGIDMIITDHHELGEQLPDAVAVIDPKDKNSGYPFTGLAGVGVALKLAWALCQSRTSQDSDHVSPAFQEFLYNACGLVALGTVADVAPLCDENRVITKYGLYILENSRNPGIQALKNISNLSHTNSLTAEDISCRIGPRINAIGRMASANTCVELLTTSDMQRAQELAKTLESTNQKRKNLQNKILQQAKTLIKDQSLDQQNVIVIGNEEWPVGLIGIIAGRLQEEYCRPVFVISFENHMGKGSARSIRGFHLFQTLQKAQQYLTNYGGHELAAGFQIERHQVAAFSRCLNEIADEVLTSEDFQPYIDIDAVIELSSINWDFMHQLEKLEPFGEGNSVPLFQVNNVEISQNQAPKRYGNKGEHLFFRVQQQNVSFPCIYFQKGELYDEMMLHSYCNIIFSIKDNEWKGVHDIQLNIKDIHFC